MFLSWPLVYPVLGKIQLCLRELFEHFTVEILRYCGFHIFQFTTSHILNDSKSILFKVDFFGQLFS